MSKLQCSINIFKVNSLISIQFNSQSLNTDSMIDNGDYPIEFLTKCAKARFKVGRCAFPGHAYDMVVRGASNDDLRSDSRKIFQEITEFLLKIQ